MTDELAPPEVEADRRCNYPGCTRARRPDPATGRPSRYCERADDGGPVHNRANAWKARRAQAGGQSSPREEGPAAPVSMARATLEQRLVELPERVADLRQYLDDVVAGIREAGDVEAAGAEVEDAHRDALTKVTEAERRAAAAERAARAAEERAETAEQQREEADALAEEALAETARVREEGQAEVAGVRGEAQAAVAGAQARLAEAEAAFATRLSERDTEVEQARRDANAAQVGAASAHAVQQAATEAAERERAGAIHLREELDQARRGFDQTRTQLEAQIDSARHAAEAATAETAALRVEFAATQARAEAAERAAEADRQALAAQSRELERERADARSEREVLRASHAEQLAQLQRNADERVQTLSESLTVARDAAETYRAQLPASGTEKRITPRKRTQLSAREDS